MRSGLTRQANSVMGAQSCGKPSVNRLIPSCVYVTFGAAKHLANLLCHKGEKVNAAEFTNDMTECVVRTVNG